MLQEFSWGQFIIAWIVLALIWYGVLLLKFYKSNLIKYYADQRTPILPIADHQPNDPENSIADSLAESPLIGAYKLPDGMQVIASDQLSFSSVLDDKMDQLGIVADVIQELKLVLAELKAINGEKQDFLELILPVKEKFGKIAALPQITQINEFMVNHLPFLLDQNELENLWD